MSKIFKNIFITLSFSIFSILTSCAQNKITIPKEFKEEIPPKMDSDQWYALNHSKNEFKVAFKNSQLTIEKTKQIYQCELKIDKGTLIGIDHGEFGGQLTFVPDDKTQKEVKIARANVKFIFQLKGKIYFITGFSHMGYSAGTISELIINEDQFSPKILIQFDDAPQAFTIYKDKLYIAADKSFYVLTDLKKEVLFENLFWEGLYPNSIAVFNNTTVFVGIRGGIVKLDLDKKNLKFYKNN